MRPPSSAAGRAGSCGSSPRHALLPHRRSAATAPSGPGRPALWLAGRLVPRTAGFASGGPRVLPGPLGLPPGPRQPRAALWASHHRGGRGPLLPAGAAGLWGPRPSGLRPPCIGRSSLAHRPLLGGLHVVCSRWSCLVVTPGKGLTVLIKGLLASEMSGKIGGIVASHNKGGQYFRIFRVPVDPGSIDQLEVRNAFQSAGSEWNGTLTPEQREDWDAYATALGSTNPLGDPIDPGGKGLYTGWMTPRLRSSLPAVQAAPLEIFRPGFTTPTIDSIDTGAQTMTIGFDDTDLWANEDDGAMFIYISPPRSLGVNFFKGPYRLADVVLGDAITAPTTPVVVPLPFTLGAGQRVFVRINISRADGRLSDSQRFQSDVT